MDRAGCLYLDFHRNSYWVEVSLTRYTSPLPTLQGVAAIGLVHLEECLL